MKYQLEIEGVLNQTTFDALVLAAVARLSVVSLLCLPGDAVKIVTVLEIQTEEQKGVGQCPT